MSAPEPGINWAETLLQGSVAAVIGAVALFLVFTLTRRWEQRKLREARTMESVAGLHLATAPTKSIDRDGMLQTYVEVQAFARALGLFGIRELREHPIVATWAFREAKRLSALHPDLKVVAPDEIRTVIRGMLDDCEGLATMVVQWWYDGKTAPFEDDAVPLGRRARRSRRS